MVSLSDKVYNILMENAQNAPYKRATVNIGGAMDANYRDQGNLYYGVDNTIDERFKPRQRITNYKKPSYITEYDMEYEAEPLDYMPSSNVKRCSCGGSMRNYKKNNQKKDTGLMYYNKCLNYVKNKGYNHNEAKEILRQFKEEYHNEFFNGGSGWSKFWNTLKDIGKVALPLIPALL